MSWIWGQLSFVRVTAFLLRFFLSLAGRTTCKDKNTLNEALVKNYKPQVQTRLSEARSRKRDKKKKRSTMISKSAFISPIGGILQPYTYDGACTAETCSVHKTCCVYTRLVNVETAL